jgi:hypothetical protein
MKTTVLFLFLFTFTFSVTNAQSLVVTQVSEEYETGFDPVKLYGWNWLYTGIWGAGSNTNVGLDAAAIWYAAIILDLSGHIGDSITKVAWYHGDSATITGKIYTGNYTNPLIQVGQTNPMTYTTPGWKQNILLQTPVEIQSPGQYWVVLAIQDPGVDHYPLGARTPLNTNAGKISTDGSTWTDLSYYSLDYSWLMGAFVYSVCPPPKTLVSSTIGPYSATVSWTAQGTALTWDIEYGPAGFVQGTGQMAMSYSNTVNLTGLTHSTNYDFYVRAICSATDTSEWEGPGTFETAWVNDSADFKSYYFGFGGEIDIIDDPNVNVTLPGSPDLSNLVAYFTTSNGVQEIKVNGVDQVSGGTPNNFYTPVIYSIMAEDSVTVKNWIVVVNGYNDISFSEVNETLIYPNPCTENFYLLADRDYLMEVVDINGSLILSRTIHSGTTLFETTGLSSGVYLVRLSDEDGVKVIKLMVY